MEPPTEATPTAPRVRSRLRRDRLPRSTALSVVGVRPRSGRGPIARPSLGFRLWICITHTPETRMGSAVTVPDVRVDGWKAGLLGGGRPAPANEWALLGDGDRRRMLSMPGAESV